MPAHRVWLIRHGRTDWNDQHRWQGHVPTSLNAEGHRQARLLATHLKDEAIGTVYSSDLPRALQTAQAVASMLELVPVVDERLREVNVGVFQALFPDELQELYPDELARWRSDDLDYAMPGGESLRALQNRIVQAFDDITDKAGHSEIAIVTHGGTLRRLVQHLAADGPHAGDHLRFANTSYTVVSRADDNRWNIDQVAATDHLSASSAKGNTSQTSF